MTSVIANELEEVRDKPVQHEVSSDLHVFKVDRRLEHHKFLGVKEWSSGYRSVNNLLLHLIRRSKSGGSKTIYLWHLYKFCQYTNRKPNELVALQRHQVEKLVQEYADSLRDASPRYSNLAIAVLKALRVG